MSFHAVMIGLLVAMVVITVCIIYCYKKNTCRCTPQLIERGSFSKVSNDAELVAVTSDT